MTLPLIILEHVGYAWSSPPRSAYKHELVANDIMNRSSLGKPARSHYTAGRSPLLKTANEQSSSRTFKKGIFGRKYFLAYRLNHIILFSIRNIYCVFVSKWKCYGAVVSFI